MVITNRMTKSGMLIMLLIMMSLPCEGTENKRREHELKEGLRDEPKNLEENGRLIKAILKSLRAPSEGRLKTKKDEPEIIHRRKSRSAGHAGEIPRGREAKSGDAKKKKKKKKKKSDNNDKSERPKIRKPSKPARTTSKRFASKTRDDFDIKDRLDRKSSKSGRKPSKRRETDTKHKKIDPKPETVKPRRESRDKTGNNSRSRRKSKSKSKPDRRSRSKSKERKTGNSRVNSSGTPKITTDKEVEAKSKVEAAKRMAKEEEQLAKQKAEKDKGAQKIREFVERIEDILGQPLTTKTEIQQEGVFEEELPGALKPNNMTNAGDVSTNHAKPELVGNAGDVDLPTDRAEHERVEKAPRKFKKGLMWVYTDKHHTELVGLAESAESLDDDHYEVTVLLHQDSPSPEKKRITVKKGHCRRRSSWFNLEKNESRADPGHLPVEELEEPNPDEPENPSNDTSEAELNS